MIVELHINVGIVALARKLLVGLWKYLETGDIPAGAEVKVTKAQKDLGVTSKQAS